MHKHCSQGRSLLPLQNTMSECVCSGADDDLAIAMPTLPIPSANRSYTYDAVYTADWDGHRPYAETAFGFQNAHAQALAAMQSKGTLTALHHASKILHKHRAPGTDILFLSSGQYLLSIATVSLMEPTFDAIATDAVSLDRKKKQCSRRLHGLASCASNVPACSMLL